METKKQEVIDLSKLSPKEELKELAKICHQLTKIIDDQSPSNGESKKEPEEENKKLKR